MKKISLKRILNSEVLTVNELKQIVGGIGGSGDNCAPDSNGLCGQNCQRSGGAAGKCKQDAGSGGKTCSCK